MTSIATLTSAALGVLTAIQPWQAPGGAIRIEGDPVVEVLARDAIPAIDNPVFGGDDRADFMRDDEIIIGVVSDGEAKAYSAWLLDSHEIVNDVIGTTPIAVTWCPLCYTSIVYVRSTGTEELTLGVSGPLWRENLVMYDRQTDSWWSQAAGRAIRGRMRGAELKTFPSDMMTWRQWRQLHPDTRVLSKRVNGRLEGMAEGYVRYHASRDVGVTGTLRRGWDGVDPKARVVSFTVGDEALSVLLDGLNSNPVLESREGDRTVLVVGSPDNTTARVFLTDSAEWSYSRQERGRTILLNTETGTEWDGYSGHPLDPAAARQPLESVPATLSYWFAWKAFYPDTRLLNRPEG